MNKNITEKMKELSLDYMSANTFGHELGHHAFKAGGQAMHELMIEDMKRFYQLLEAIKDNQITGTWTHIKLSNVLKEFKEKNGEI